MKQDELTRKVKKALRPPRVLRMKQIAVAPWDGNGGMTYSVIGLATDGRVYRFEIGQGGWVPYIMEVVS